VVCHVGKQKPITDKHLKEQILRRPRDYELYEEFKRELKKSGRATKKRDVGKSLSN
jgi:ribosomal protein S21